MKLKVMKTTETVSSLHRALLLAFSALAVPAALAADDEAPPRYASAASFNWTVDGGDVAKGSGLRLAYGMPLSAYIAVELQGALGGDSHVAGVNTELKELLGAHLRLQYPFNEAVTAFARYGYSRVKFEVDDGIATRSETETGGGYGGGIEMKVLSGLLDGGLRLTADYTVYLDKAGGELVARSVGLRLDF